jgi:hypothetical protein
LQIQEIDGTVSFPWFDRILTSEEVEAYTIFISQLCKTAIKKSKVTAKPRKIEGSEKYAMRCFLLSLNMIGDEYGISRKMLLSKMEGDSSWKYGKPEETAAADEDGGGEKEEVTALSIIPEKVELEAAGVNDLEEALADAELIHAVNESFEETDSETVEEIPEKTEHEMILEQIPADEKFIKSYNAAEDGEMRVITAEIGSGYQYRYAVKYEDGYPRITRKE